MDKTAIKKFAIESRDKLIDDIQLKAETLGITADGIREKLDISTPEVEYYIDDSHPITGSDISKRQQLIKELKQRAKKNDFETAFKDLVEEVAYTWFNRIIAIRFMEVNDYLPSRTNVLSSTHNRNEPDIMIDPLSIEDDLGGFTDSEKELIEKANDTLNPTDMDNLYHMLFIKQANALNKNLPYLFEKTNNYAELLFTPNYHSGVIKHLIDDVNPDDFDVEKGGQVEIIGWLYQYYNTEPKDYVIGLPKSHKFRDTEIASATQIFTPDWIVKYMVENSLGKLWIKSLIQKGDNREEKEIASQFGWQYYMADAEQPENVLEALKKYDDKLDNLSVDDIKLIDPAMGSGHILVYSFDVLMNIYESEGYSKRDATQFILDNNLFGLDIDTRAFQLSYFAIMMKARQYNRRALSKIKTLNIHDIPGTDDYSIEDFDILLDKLSSKISAEVKHLLTDFTFGEQFGSLINEQNIHIEEIRAELDIINRDQLSFELIPLTKKINDILNSAELLMNKYHIVVTNPPYMGSARMDKELSNYAKKNYPNSKSDFFAMFMERWNKSLLPGGYNSMVTMQSWMFLSSFEKMRINLLNNYTISNLMHMENNVMGIAFGTAVTIVRNMHISEFIGTYHQIKTADATTKIPQSVPISGNRYNRTNQANFSKIPGMPIAYWADNNVINHFNKDTVLKNISPAQRGLTTGNNNRFIKKWWEIYMNKANGEKWFPYNKGGNNRKWYGNRDLVVNYENNGESIRIEGEKTKKTFGFQGKKYYFRKGITWTALTSSKNSFRYSPEGCIFDSNKGPMLFPDSETKLFSLLAFFNSPVMNYLTQILNPTLSLQNGDMNNVPVNKNIIREDISFKSEDNIDISKNDWDSFETSWDFKHHPLLLHIADDKRNEVNGSLQNAFNIWRDEAQSRFDQLKSNEEELNRIFIDLYGLNDELTPEVEDKDVSVRLADETRDIKSFLSYFIGVVFGRYSLDTEGLAFAGGDWDSNKYKTFVPNEDNILMLNDEKYFDDSRDIINRLKEFLKVTFGEDSVKLNLRYIASIVGKRAGTDEDSIRRYFVEDFFKDHKKIYQKRPIYWEFSSGRNNGFKALMYLHRYDENELAMLRTDYLHPLQGQYESRLQQLKSIYDVESVAKEKKNIEKSIKHVTKQLEEIRTYDQSIQHLANKQIQLDLDDGVVVNYSKLQDGKSILTKI